MSRKIYLDYSATTPIHVDVRNAISETLEEGFGNPSSLHWAGQSAGKVVAKARVQVSQGLNTLPESIYFTSGATEADNLALTGYLKTFVPENAHLITSAIEHHAILHTAKHLETQGYSVTYLPVDSKGLIDPNDLRKAIRPETVLISIMMVNNEVGSIQPIEEIGLIAREYGIALHCDAVQGLGIFDVDVNLLNMDFLSLSAHKIYGPKGVGALYIRQGMTLTPLLYGGTQENQVRPGTENVPGISGLGAAVQLTSDHKAKERIRLAGLRQQLIEGLRNEIPGLLINGPENQSAPHILSVSFPLADAEMMLIRLNSLGVAVSMGSACTSRSIEPSHVLTAMGLPLDQIEGTLRISMGYPTTLDDIEGFLEIISDVYRRSLLTSKVKNHKEMDV